MEYRVENIRQFGKRELELWFTQADREKQQRILRLRHVDDQLRSLCADHLAREMLSRRLNCSPAELSFCKTDLGKPYLPGAPICFNLSHSADFVACAVASSPVGIDIEQLRPIRPQLCKKVCTADELSYVHPNGEFSFKNFLFLWTAKEAALKMTGRGIGADLSGFPVMQSGRFSLPDCVFTQTETKEYILTVAQSSRPA